VLILDAGPIYAASATRDRNHRRCIELLTRAPRPLLVPELVVTEVSYLLGDRIGPHAEIAFARAIADGEVVVESVRESEWERIAELTEQYRDLPLGIVDASVVVLAERHAAREIATLDYRHFAVVRPRHVASFRLLPEGGSP
jgi:predicted nucleic acid-binding protein